MQNRHKQLEAIHSIYARHALGCIKTANAIADTMLAARNKKGGS